MTKSSFVAVAAAAVAAVSVTTGSVQSHSLRLTNTTSIADCTASDAALKAKRDIACACGFTIPTCTPSNASGDHDWPSQVTYMHDAITTLQQTTPECLSTPFVNDTVYWLKGTLLIWKLIVCLSEIASTIW